MVFAKLTRAVKDKSNKVQKAVSDKTSKVKHIVALDIGTEFVKVLIGRVAPHPDKPSDYIAEIIGVGRKRQSLTDMNSGAISDIGGVVDNCDEALSQAEEMAGVSAKDAIIGIAGELVKGMTITIKYKRSNSEAPIELVELNRIMDKVLARALERAQAQVAAESGLPDIEIKMVNSAVVSVHIDGYKITNPIGFPGKDVAVQLFCAFAPMVHIGAIERVAHELDLNLLDIAAEPFAVAKSVGGQADEAFSALFIDIGGGTSDIALVNEGGVEGTKMFGIGGRSFTRAIAAHLGVSFEEAEQLKLDWSDGKLEGDKYKKVKEALLPTVKVWMSGVELALSEYDNIDQLPSKIMMCGGGSGLVYLHKALESPLWREKLPFAKDLEISLIRPEQVERVRDLTGKANDFTFVTPMGLLNLGLDDLFDYKAGTSLMQRFNRSLSV